MGGGWWFVEHSLRDRGEGGYNGIGGLQRGDLEEEQHLKGK